MNYNNFNKPTFNPTQSTLNNQQLTNPIKKKRVKKRNRFRNGGQQDNCFFKDDIEGHKSFYDFRFVKRGEITINDLMNKVKERQKIELDFLDKLVVGKLNNDEESDVVKTVIKKLLDILHTYQLSSLSEEEKSIIKSRGYLKTDSS